jgi:DNA-binding transcriptional ArsR family regulator
MEMCIVSESLQQSLKQKLSFTYREPIEMVIAMSINARKDQMLRLAEELHIEVDPFLNTMLDQAEDTLSPYLKRELNYFFDYDFYRWGPDVAFYATAFEGKEGETAEEWINRLEEMPAQQVVALMVRCAYSDKLHEFLQGRPWADIQSDLTVLSEQVRKVEPSDEIDKTRSHLLECLAHPEETKQRYMLVIRQFYRIVFAPHEREIRSRCETAVARYEMLFQADPERFVHDFHKIDPAIYTRSAIHHISFMIQVTSSQLNIGKNADWIIFGINNERHFGPEAARNKVEKFLKVFSDKRRLEFVRLLAERPRFGQELAAELGITPAAVNYHASSLILLDLVEHKRSEHRLYYHINKEKVREMLDLTAQVLLGEETYKPVPESGDQPSLGGGKDEPD